MQFKINGKIIFVSPNQKKIKLLIYTDKDIEHFNHINKLLKQEPKLNNTYNMIINNKTKFDILDYIQFKNVKDLLNLNVTISGYTKYYCFDIGDKNDIINSINIKKGNSFIINKMTIFKDNN